MFQHGKDLNISHMYIILMSISSIPSASPLLTGHADPRSQTHRPRNSIFSRTERRHSEDSTGLKILSDALFYKDISCYQCQYIITTSSTNSIIIKIGRDKDNLNMVRPVSNLSQKGGCQKIPKNINPVKNI